MLIKAIFATRPDCFPKPHRQFSAETENWVGHWARALPQGVWFGPFCPNFYAMAEHFRWATSGLIFRPAGQVWQSKAGRELKGWPGRRGLAQRPAQTWQFATWGEERGWERCERRVRADQTVRIVILWYEMKDRIQLQWFCMILNLFIDFADLIGGATNGFLQ